MGNFTRQAMVLLVVCLPQLKIFSQTGVDSALVALHGWFDSTVGIENNGLYTGPIYLMVAKSRTTHPFFDSRLWQSGNITLGPDQYVNVKMMYDIHTDQVILKHPDVTRRDGISVDMARLTAFNLGSNDFIRTGSGARLGIYQVLYSGQRFDLLCRRKKVASLTSQGTIFESQNQIFLRTNGQLHTLRRKADLIKIYQDHEEHLKDITRTHGIKFKLKDEGQLIAFISKFDEVID